MDESLINNFHTTENYWTDGSIEMHGQLNSIKGRRFILLAAISNTGLVNNSFSIWTGKEKDEDYHSDMNGTIFESWMNNKILKELPNNAVFVIDRARYHLQLDPEYSFPTDSYSKAKLIEWLISKNAISELS